jgi:hypothetical protein
MIAQPNFPEMDRQVPLVVPEVDILIFAARTTDLAMDAVDKRQLSEALDNCRISLAAVLRTKRFVHSPTKLLRSPNAHSP